MLPLCKKQTNINDRIYPIRIKILEAQEQTQYQDVTMTIIKFLTEDAKKKKKGSLSFISNSQGLSARLSASQCQNVMPAHLLHATDV